MLSTRKSIQNLSIAIALLIMPVLLLTGCFESSTFIPIEFEVQTDSLRFQSNGGQESFVIKSNTIDLTATVSSDATSWLEASTVSDNGMVTVRASENLSVTPRTATITVTGKGVKTPKVIGVKMTGATPTLEVSPLSLSFDVSKGERAFTVASNTNWDISKSESDWLTLSMTSGSAGTTVVIVQASANTITAERKATITVSVADMTPQSIQVTQSAVPFNLTVSPTTLSFGASEETKTFDVASNTSWTVTYNASWLTVTPLSGSTGGAVAVKADVNTIMQSRETTITVSGGGITRDIRVTQSAAAAYLNVLTTSMSFSSSAGQDFFTISSNRSWTVSSSESWLRVSPTSGSDDRTVTVTVDDYTSTTTSRNATITVSGGSSFTHTINVTQSAAGVYLTVSPTSLSLPAAATQSPFSIESNVSWQARSDQSWITVYPTSGTYDGSFTAIVVENTVPLPRDGNITVIGGGITRTIPVSQSAAAVTLNVSPASISLSSAGDRAPVTITSNISWTAISNQPVWLTVSPESGSSNGTIYVTATANPFTTSRPGTLTVSGEGVTRTINVTQAASTQGGSRGTITFWNSDDIEIYGNVVVTLHGAGIETITRSHRTNPGCSASGTATFANIPHGTYTYSAVSKRKSWGPVTISLISDCMQLRLD